MASRIIDASQMRRSEEATEIEAVMSNMDHAIDAGVARQLKRRPGAVFAQHAAWNFCGYVWYQDSVFMEEVWVFNKYQATYGAETLDKLMRDVNEVYGQE